MVSKILFSQNPSSLCVLKIYSPVCDTWSSGDEDVWCFKTGSDVGYPSFADALQADWLIWNAQITWPARLKYIVLYTDCIRPLGIENGTITDSQMSASSIRVPHSPWLARIDSDFHAGDDSAWSNALGSTNPWLVIDMGAVYTVHRVATQGVQPGSKSEPPRNYTLSYAIVIGQWEGYQNDKVFNISLCYRLRSVWKRTRASTESRPCNRQCDSMPDLAI